MINFACFSPHPPILLPTIGQEKDRKEVKKTIFSLEALGEKIKKINPDKIIISSPHPDWGFNVPLFFLARKSKSEIIEVLIGSEPPYFYFEKGKNFYFLEIEKNKNKKYALIASGDLSHRLKKEGPYGFHPQGPKFDKNLIKYLKKKNIKKFLELDEKFPEAGECGLRSFSFLLGILEASGINWQPEILSYEGPFGVGYLVAEFKIL